MDRDNYWTRLHKKRLSRRRLLGTGALGVAGVAGLALMGCGDDGDTDTDDTDDAPDVEGSPESPAADGDIPRGGVTSVAISVEEPSTLNPEIGPGVADVHNSMTLNRLLRFKTSAEDPNAYAAYEVEPDLAESYEVTDPNVIIFSLRGDAKTHDKPPLNGRLLTGDDVKFAFENYRENGVRANLFEPIDSIEVQDDTTVVFTLKEPRVDFINLTAYPGASWITPPEIMADDDLKNSGPFGAGPFLFDRHERGTGLFYSRNPEYFVPEWPYVDEARLFYIGDPRTVVANMESGELDWAFAGEGVISPVDARALEGNGDLTVYDIPETTSCSICFSPASYTADAPPFNDERVRQAVMLAIDYAGIREAVYGGSASRSGPIVSPSMAPFWGLADDHPLAEQFFSHNPEEARRLLEAAGYQGEEFELHFNLGYGPAFQTEVEAISASLRDVGFNPSLTSWEDAQYDSEVLFNPEFNGMLYALVTAFTDPGQYLNAHLNPLESTYGYVIEVPEITELVRQQNTIFDVDERRQAFEEILSKVVEGAYFPPGVRVNQAPVINNRLVNFQYCGTTSVGLETIAKYGIRA